MSARAGGLGRWWPAALGALSVLGLYGHLAAPDRVLAARDMAFLHLPLRTDFKNLLAHGLPSWDPWLHGGQPLLSNPHYAAWYPTTWMLLALPPHVALQWAILLHAALAFAGGWRLARRWGAGRSAAAFAAIAFLGGGCLAGLATLPLVFFGMAWWPWIMAAGDRALRSTGEAEGGQTRACLVLAALLAIQILNGDPAAVLASGLGLLALAAEAHLARSRPWRALGVALVLALALAAVQVVPTILRARDSARAAGLGERESAVWSTQPIRLVETVFPRLYGDPARDEEDLYFGWSLHDHAYPLLLSIYPGLLVTLLGIAGLLRRGSPHRLALGVGVITGIFLGVGRHEPLWPVLHRLIPFLAQLRYPEKFLLLAMSCLVFSAALELDHLLAVRRGEVTDRRAFFVPLTLAAICLTASVIVASFHVATPGAAANFVRSHSGLPPSPAALTKGVDLLRREALATAALTSLALIGLLALRARVPWRAAAVFVVGLLGVDLWRNDRRLSPTMARADFARVAPIAGSIPAGERVFYEGDMSPDPAVGLRLGPPGEQQLRTRLGRLEPLSATLWGHPEVLERDFDLTLTGWGRWARRLLEREWTNPAHATRILAAWNVAARVRPRSPQEMLESLRAGDRSPSPATIEASTPLPMARSLTEATFHADPEAAVAAARAEGFDVAARENLVGSPTGARRFTLAQVEITESAGDRLAVDLRALDSAGEPVLVVLAMTFDDGWTASAAGARVPTWPTALGQLALVAPPGARRVELHHRDPWVRVGGLVSTVALLGAALAVLRSRRRAWPEGARIERG
jgi:hypothetical protein